MTPSEETTPLDLILDKWEEAFEEGNDIPPELLCNSYPELLETLREKINALKNAAFMDQKTGVVTVKREEDEDDADDPLISTVLDDKYRIDATIGKGGYGKVYRAFDLELERNVAIKISRHSKKKEGHRGADLLAEARKVAKLEHGGIVTVHDVGETEDGRPFIVSDLIKGGSLADVIENRRLDPNESARLVAKIADALHYAHQSGLIHRDIKPDNILLDHDSNPLITDFGIAQEQDECGRTASPIGTVPYMAPEQFSDDVPMDHRADIYSLGVVLYVLLAGKLPFNHPDYFRTIKQIQEQDPEPVYKHNSKVSDQLEAICLKCLAKNPEDRFASAAELQRAILQTTKEPRRYGTKVTVLAVLCLAVVVSYFTFQSIFSKSPSNNLGQVASEGNGTISTAGELTSYLGTKVFLSDWTTIIVVDPMAETIEYSFDNKQWELATDFSIGGVLASGTVENELIHDMSQTIYVRYTNIQGTLSPVYPVPVISVKRGSEATEKTLADMNQRVRDSMKDEKDDTNPNDLLNEATDEISAMDEANKMYAETMEELWAPEREREYAASLVGVTLYFNGHSDLSTGVNRSLPSTFEAWLQPSHVEKPNLRLPEREMDNVIHGEPSFEDTVGLLCGSTLSDEHHKTLSKLSLQVPSDQWSHVTTVYTGNETRFYLNGKLVATDPNPNDHSYSTVYIGRASVTSHIELNVPEHYGGQIRCMRISEGERYKDDFTPDKTFTPDNADAPYPAICIYDGTKIYTDENDRGRVTDLSGNDNDAMWRH